VEWHPAGAGKFYKRVGDFPSRGRIITMAQRYQDRSFPAGNDYDRDDGSHGSPKAESDPLAELARLIGQTDPFGTMGRANLPLQPHARPQSRPTYQDEYEHPPQAHEEEPPPAPPAWMQRGARQETLPPPVQPQQDYPGAVHPLHRYAATHPPAQSDYDAEPSYAEPSYDEPSYDEPSYADSGHERDLSRYDDALYGSVEQDADDFQHDQAYADDGYAYDEEPAAEQPKRRGGMVTVIAVLALAVFGVGGAFAYRTYSGSARRGEPPIIRADAGPTKIIPSPPDGGAKVPDRMTSGDGTEKLVSREETPLDPNAKSAPRVVWPTPSQSYNPPPVASTAPAAPSAGSASGTFANGEAHKIRTFAVRGEQADAGVPAAAPPPPPAAKPAPRAAAAPAPAQRTASAANASANAPLSLSPQGSPASAATNDSQARVAAVAPAQAAPGAGASSGGYLVQVSSQRSEADAQASYKALQGKFPSVLGSHAPVIKRADLGEKGVYYRAMVGPFGSPDEASQLCGSLKAAGGQCVVQRN
jgi:SPOR domain